MVCPHGSHHVPVAFIHENFGKGGHHPAHVPEVGEEDLALATEVADRRYYIYPSHFGDRPLAEVQPVARAWDQVD